MSAKEIYISQTLMKSYTDYLTQKMCGLFFKAKYIDKDPEAEMKPSDVMLAGIYFEYLCTGALPRNGQVPSPKYAYFGTPKQKLTEDYQRAVDSAAVFQRICDRYGIKIKKAGLDITINGYKGIIDVHASIQSLGEEDVFIDIKRTGLIDNKWDEMGWDVESLHMKDTLMIQGVHYKLLAREKLGIHDIPFYFFVFSDKDPEDVKIIRQVVDESKIQSHIVAVQNMREMLNRNIQKGFKAYPDQRKCSKCPISHKCDKKIDYPKVLEVHY